MGECGPEVVRPRTGDRWMETATEQMMREHDRLQTDKLILILTSHYHRAVDEVRRHAVRFERSRGVGILTNGVPFRLGLVERHYDLDRYRGIRPNGVLFIHLREDIEGPVKEICPRLFPGAEFADGWPKDPSQQFYGTQECPECGCNDWSDPLYEAVREDHAAPYWIEDMAAPMPSINRSRVYRECNYCGEKKYD